MDEFNVVEDPFMNEMIDDYEEEQRQKALAEQEKATAEPEQTPLEKADAKVEDTLEKSRQEGTEFAKDVFSGIGDFVLSDIPGAVAWATEGAEVKGLNETMKNIQSWWQDVNPRHELPAENLTRDLSSVVIPSILAPNAVVGAFGKATKAVSISNRVRILGGAAASIGVDTGIAAISATSVRDDNISRTLNDTFGWNIPWATRDDDSPDVRRQKNVIDNMPFAFLGDAVGAYFSLKQAQKIIPMTPAAADVLEDPLLRSIRLESEALTSQFEADSKMIGKVRAPSGGIIDRDSNIKKVLGESKDINKPEFEGMKNKLVEEAADNEITRIQMQEAYFKDNEELMARRAARLAEMEDPVVDAVQTGRRTSDEARTDEGMRRLAADPEGAKGADPYINTLDDVTAPTPSKTADAIGAKVDYARMQNGIGTTDGQARAVATDYWQKQFSQITDATTRSKYLDKLFQSIAPPVGAQVKQGERVAQISPKMIQDAVTKLADVVLMDEIPLEEFTTHLNGIKALVSEGEKYLDPQTAIATNATITRVLNELYDPGNIRASAMLTQNAADTVSNAGEAVVSMGQKYNSSAQQGLVFEKLELMASEVESSKFVQRHLKGAIEAAQQGPIKTARALAEQRKIYEDGLAFSKNKGGDFVATMKDIATNDPEWLKPMIEMYNHSMGDVDDLYKLKKWTENSLGFLKKAFYDMGDTEVPSVLVQQLWGVKYNSMLSGLSALKAGISNGIFTALQPATVFIGSAATFDTKALTRAMYNYGGVSENFKRALRMMGQEYKYAVNNPMRAMMKGREDLIFQNEETMRILESTTEGLRAEANEGKLGSAALLMQHNMAKVLHGFNNNPIVRFGMNAMYAFDGFTRSFMESGAARAQAYDDVLNLIPGGKMDDALFQKKQQELYDKAFDPEGLWRNRKDHASAATAEIALNQENKMAAAMDPLFKQVPAAKALMMFPRTGLNGLAMSWSYIPTSNLMPITTKARKAFAATTPSAVRASLIEHGYTQEFIENYNPETLITALRNQYRGRQIMGSTVVMGAGMWALEGNLTGSGPKDHAERARMRKMGWEPYSVKIAGEWRSYRDIPPFSTILGLVADTIYEAKRVDSDWAQETLQKISWSLGSNIVNQTFLSGIQPLAEALSGSPHAWTKILSREADTLIPGSGARSILNNAIAPQLKDIENDIGQYIQNRMRFLPPIGGGLENELDIYTGKPINYLDPFTAATNALLPFFKTNGGREPWRQWLLDTGWDRLNEPRRNPLTLNPATPEQRQWLNNWIATEYVSTGYFGASLGESIKIMSEDPQWQEHIDTYRMLQQANGHDMKNFDISRTPTHRVLSQMHTDAYEQAWAAWGRQHQTNVGLGQHQRSVNEAMERSQLNMASDWLTDKTKKEKKLQEMEALIKY